MAFAPGNQEGAKADHRRPKLFRDALLAALKKADGDADKIQRVANQLVAKAIEGDVPAIREIADRIDGKVPQAVGGDDDMPAIKHVTEVRYTIVDPRPAGAASLPPAAEPGSV